MKTKNGLKMRSVLGESVLVAEGANMVDFNKIISLNSTAAWLWQQVEGKEFTPESLAQLLVGEYEVEETVAKADAENLVQQWLNAGIVEE